MRYCILSCTSLLSDRHHSRLNVLENTHWSQVDYQKMAIKAGYLAYNIFQSKVMTNDEAPFLVDKRCRSNDKSKATGVSASDLVFPHSGKRSVDVDSIRRYNAKYWGSYLVLIRTVIRK